MSIYFHIEHTTTYQYPSAISFGQNLGYLAPRNEEQQNVLHWKLDTLPIIPSYTSYTDYFGNELIYFAIEEPHNTLSVTSSSIVQVLPVEESLLSDVPWEIVVDQLCKGNTQADIIARQYCFASPFIENNIHARAMALSCFTPGRGIVEASHALMTKIFTEFKYEPNATSVDSSVADVMQSKQGVCQDFAHIAISGLRSIGLAAAYVSGYLETVPPKGTKKLRGADASHAWFSVYIPACGWFDFDPTNNITPRGQHIVVARGRDFGDVTPLKGVYLGSTTPKLSVAVDVNRLSKEKALILAGIN